MADILDFTSALQRSERVPAWPAPAVVPAAPESLPAPDGEPIGRARILPPWPTWRVSDPLFFNVRSFARRNGGRTLQFGFVDARANVVFSAFAKQPSESDWRPGPGATRLAVEPLEPEPLARMLALLCRDADLVGSHRVLQGGLLPQTAIESAGSLACLWRRMQAAAKTGRISLPGDRPLRLDDALRLAGLEPMESDDAVVGALAVRELWLWLDSLG
jgi:hypothetical protein